VKGVRGQGDALEVVRASLCENVDAWEVHECGYGHAHPWVYARIVLHVPPAA